MSTPKLNFLPGTVIKSSLVNGNFDLLFNKKLVIPLKLSSISPAGMTYSLSVGEINSIKALLGLDPATSLQLTDITTALTLNDIVDVIDTSSGDPLREPFPDSPTSVLVFGKITTITMSSVVISFYKDPSSPVAFTISTTVDLLIPVKAALHAIPEDALRTEFVNSFETEVGPSNDIDRLFDNTGVSRLVVDSPSLKTNTDNHIAASTGVHGVTGAVVGTTDTQTLTNKRLDLPKINENVDVTVTSTQINSAVSSSHTQNTDTGTTSTTFEIGNTQTAGLILSQSGLTTSDKTFTFPDISSVVVTDTATQTLTNKTLTAPVIATIVNTGTLTLPTSTDTLVGRATTDTLTNKTIAFGSNTLTDVVSTNTIQTITAAKTFTAAVSINPSLTVSGSSTGGIFIKPDVSNSNQPKISFRDLTDTERIFISQISNGTLQIDSTVKTIIGTNGSEDIYVDYNGGSRQVLFFRNAPTVLSLTATSASFSVAITADGGITATGASISFNSKNLTSVGTINTHTIPAGTDTFTLNATSQTLTNKTIDSSTNIVRATSLATTTSPVVVSGSTAPTTGQTLIATSPTTATWQSVTTDFDDILTVFGTGEVLVNDFGNVLASF